MKSDQEHREQKALFQWARLSEKRLPQLVNLYAIPNGGQRHIRVAVKLKAEGVKAGVPDVCLAWPNRQGGRVRYHGLYIEMKSAKGRPTDSQKLWMDNLSKAGYLTAVCRSANDAITLIEDYLGK